MVRTSPSCWRFSEPFISGVASPAALDSSARLDHDTFFVMLAMAAPRYLRGLQCYFMNCNKRLHRPMFLSFPHDRHSCDSWRFSNAAFEEQGKSDFSKFRLGWAHWRARFNWVVEVAKLESTFAQLHCEVNAQTSRPLGRPTQLCPLFTLIKWIMKVCWREKCVVMSQKNKQFTRIKNIYCLHSFEVETGTIRVRYSNFPLSANAA